MASISKPFTFYAGEKAKANEVNENFDVVYAGVNELDRKVTDVDVSILEINEGKANINGSAQQAFQVADASSSYEAVNKGQLDRLLPTGSIIMVTHGNTPQGYLECTGGAISRSTYSRLFAVVGTTYGAGDGSNTFNLPNFQNRTPWGKATSSGFGYINAGLPNITGYLKATDSVGSGAFTSQLLGRRPGGSGQGDSQGNYWFDASRSNAIYGASSTVQPPAIRVRFLIKY